MKKIGVLMLTCILMFSFSGCLNSSIKKTVETDINFSRNDVFLLAQEIITEIKDDTLILYKVNNKSGKIEKYATINGKYEVADSTNNLLLLQGKESLLIYDIVKKKSYEIYNEVYDSLKRETHIKYQVFFAKSTGDIIVKKIILDKEKPIIFGETSVGYQVSEESGIYVYNFSNGNLKFKNKAVLADFQILIGETDEIDISCVDMGDGNISMVVKVYPATIPFYTEYYYKIAVSDLSYKLIGESKIDESQDDKLQYSYLKKRLIKADDKLIICVDFESEKVFRFEHEDVGKISGVDILDVPANNFFFVNLSTASGDNLFKYQINENGLGCEKGNFEMLSVLETIQNGFDRGNKIFFPPDNESRKFGDLFVNGTTYRSYSQMGYLCEKDGKTVVIFE